MNKNRNYSREVTKLGNNGVKKSERLLSSSDKRTNLPDTNKKQNTDDETECEKCDYIKEMTNIKPAICDYHVGLKEGIKTGAIWGKAQQKKVMSTSPNDIRVQMTKEFIELIYKLNSEEQSRIANTQSNDNVVNMGIAVQNFVVGLLKQLEKKA